jgi:HK97 family phage major capsid protein
MPTIQQLKDQRASVWDKMKEVMDVAEREGRDLSGEERAKYDAAEVDLDRLGDQIDLQEKHAQRAADMGKVDRSQVATGEKELSADERGENYRKAFSGYLRSGLGDLEPEDKRALLAGHVDLRAAGVGTSTAGGYTVPPGFRANIIQTLKTFGGMLQVAEVINTDTGANLQWPTNDDTANVGAILAENTQMSPSRT